MSEKGGIADVALLARVVVRQLRDEMAASCMRRSASALALMIATLIASSASASLPDEAAKVSEVVQRTKTTRATYALYNWNRITRPGQSPVEEWGAEFNAGALHRVETPRDRVIADCAAGTGSYYSVATGKVGSGPGVAGGACGINTNRPATEAHWLGSIATAFGKADRIQLSDDKYVRTYDVRADGVIVHEVIAQNLPGEPPLIVTDAIAILPVLPSPQIFDEKSLHDSFVPDRFRRPSTKASR